MLVIGLMSGTSMDGIDAVLMQTDGKTNITVIEKFSLKYDWRCKTLFKAMEHAYKKAATKIESDIKSGVKREFTKTLITQEAHQFNFIEILKDYLVKKEHIQEIALQSSLEEIFKYLPNPNLQAIEKHSTALHAYAVKDLLAKAQRNSEEIDLIGCHGQTVYHNPKEKITIQISDGQLLADETAITVINDFRSNDIKHGGQGAPFAPLYHQALILSTGNPSGVIVNLGGIANISVIAGKAPENVMLGFDTGAANKLIDEFVKQFTHGKELMDKDGNYGLHGTVNAAALNSLFSKAIVDEEGVNFFDKAPPKSLDSNDIIFPKEFTEIFAKTDDPAKNKNILQDACATLAAFTAYTIANSVDYFKEKSPTYWILTGGGAYNAAIKMHLQQALEKKLNSQIKVENAAEAGFDIDSMEAQIFAWMAARSIQGLPLSIPQTTGAPWPMPGGHAHVPTNSKIKDNMRNL